MDDIQRPRRRANHLPTQTYPLSPNPISKTLLYRMLNNRAYIGEAVHKGTGYAGEHQRLIDQKTWDNVQSIFRQSPRLRASNTRPETPALLKGLICGPDGAAFSPTRTRKGERLYRYYVSQTVLKHVFTLQMIAYNLVRIPKRQAKAPDLSAYPWVPFLRSMLNRANDFLEEDPLPWGEDKEYLKKIVDITKDCDSIRILVIGPYTSFVRYYPMIQDRVSRIVIMGQPIGDESATPGKESFNCSFDMAACQKAMVQLDGKPTFFVDIPHFNECREAETPPSRCYAPSLEMIAGSQEQPGLEDAGLAGRIKKALVNDITCQTFYASKEQRKRACSSLSTWEPRAVARGPGGEALLWDQSAALFLVEPDAFELFYTAENPAVGGKHYEPRLIDSSHEKTVKALRLLYTDYANRAANFK